MSMLAYRPALLLSVLPTAGSAKVYCVGDSAQLDAALLAAQNTAGADEVRMTGGDIVTDKPIGGVRWRYEAISSDALTLSGGWNGGCTARVGDPFATRLSAAGFGRAFELVVDAGVAPELRLENFTLLDGFTTAPSGTAGLTVSVAAGATPAIHLERLILTRNTNGNGFGAGLGVSLYGGQLSVLGCWILDNSAISNSAGSLFADATATIYLNNNTVVHNRSDNPNGIGGLNLLGTGFYWVANNVFYDNTRPGGVATDLRLPNGLGILRNNHIGALIGTAGSNTGMSSGDPKFTSDGYDAPTLSSPLRNSGFPTPNGGLPSASLLGDSRVAGGTIDRGAFEFQELFANGFE